MSGTSCHLAFSSLFNEARQGMKGVRSLHGVSDRCRWSCMAGAGFSADVTAVVPNPQWPCFYCLFVLYIHFLALLQGGSSTACFLLNPIVYQTVCLSLLTCLFETIWHIETEWNVFQMFCKEQIQFSWCHVDDNCTVCPCTEILKWFCYRLQGGRWASRDGKNDLLP